MREFRTMPRRGQFLFILLMCVFMSCVMAFAMTFIRLGFSSMLVHEWLKNWAIAFCVAVPTASFAVPLARSITDWFVR